MNVQKLIAPVITWAVLTAVFVTLLLTLGKNWKGVGHAFVPAIIIAGAFTGVVFFVIWAFKSQFGGRSKIAEQAAEVLKERYLGDYMERGALGEPRVIVGGTLRYSGNIQGVRVELDFFTAPINFPAFEYDLNALKLRMRVALAQIRLWLPQSAGNHEGLIERAKTATSFVDADYGIMMNRLYNTGEIVLTDELGRDTLSPDRFKDFLNGLVSTVRSSV